MSLRTASRTILRTAAARTPVAAAPRALIAPRRSLATLEKQLYTAEAVASGAGRDGKTESKQNGMSLQLAMPKELGGNGKGANPEQLFAMGESAGKLPQQLLQFSRKKHLMTDAQFWTGYAACFLSALQLSARTAKVQLPSDVAVTAQVHIGKPNDGKPFGLAVDLHVKSAKADQAQLKDLVNKAHEVRFGLSLQNAENSN